MALQSIDSIIDVSDHVSIDGNTLRLPPLYYLELAMKRYNFGRRDIAEKLGLEVSSVRYWMVTSKDVSIARLFQIAQAFDLNLRFKIEPDKKKGTGVVPKDCGVTVTSEICLKTSEPLK